MLGALLKLIPGGGGWLTLAAFLAGSAAGAYGAGFYWGARLAQADAALARQEAALSASEKRYADREAQIEADRADAETRASQAIQAQARESARLRAQLAAAQIARQQASRRLTAALNEASRNGEAFPLSPPALAYLAAVRAEQGMEL